MLAQSAAAYTLPVTDTVYKKKKEEPKANFKEKLFQPPLILKTSPTAIIGGGVFLFTAEYRMLAEITTGRKSSQQFGISYLSKSLFLYAAERSPQNVHGTIYKVDGWKVQYTFKYYLIGRRHHAPYGFYTGPLISYANAHVAMDLKRQYRDTYYDFRNFSMNGIIGVQMGKMNRLTVDLYAGLGYRNYQLFYHYNSNRTTQIDLTDLGLGDLYTKKWIHLNGLAGINIGYSF